MTTEDLEFGERLRRLAAVRAERLGGQPSDRALARALGVSATTVGNWLRGGALPKDVEQLVELVEQIQRAARVRGVLDEVLAEEFDLAGWRAAHQAAARRVADRVAAGTSAAIARSALVDDRPGLPIGHLRRPDGAVRVREARPRLLGVHAAIRVEEADGELPPYAPRDLDADLRAMLAAATGQGGFVLLVGGSSVGKTRALFEAVGTVIPEWWLVHPTGVGQIRDLLPTQQRIVVWLDELQRYLDPATGLTAGVVRDLVTAGLVLVGTLWPHEYTTRIAPPHQGAPDPHSNDRQLLDLAQVLHVPGEFSAAERRRAEALSSDRRIRIALDSPDGGITQVLAAGPALVHWWENAPDPYSKAVISAALDACRAGAHAPLSRQLLAAATRGYLTVGEQAVAPADWLDTAVGYATTELHGAAAVLNPVPVSGEPGTIAGYTVADYLHQHTTVRRRTTCIPDAVWQALTDHHNPIDTVRLAFSAACRGRYQHARVLYQAAADAGHPFAARLLIESIVEQDDLDELRRRADASDQHAANFLPAMTTLEDPYRARVSPTRRYVRPSFRQHIEAGHLDEAARMLKSDRYVFWGEINLLADRLVDTGRFGEAEAMLRERARSGHWEAARKLADVLVKGGRIDELRRQAAAGDHLNDVVAWFAHMRLLDWFVEHGHLDELQRLSDAGDSSAGHHLVDLFAEQNRLDELEDEVHAGTPGAAQKIRSYQQLWHEHPHSCPLVNCRSGKSSINTHP